MSDNWATQFTAAREEQQRLIGQKARIEGETAQVERSLEEKKAAARQAFGTDDPNELEKMATEIDAQNEAVATEFVQKVHNVRTALRATSGGPGMGMGG